MKKVFCALSLLLVFSVGCAEKKPTNSVEGIDQSEVDKYNEMLENDNKAMSEAGDEDPR